jgi:acyl-CoA synthetase (NDP forming)
MSDAIRKLMEPQSIAVIGASTDPKKTAGRPIAYLQKHHFKGAIFPVNPRVSEIGGLPCYPNIAALPKVPDVAIILVGIDKALEAVKELAAIGTPAAILLTSGYAEVGLEGLKRQEDLVLAAGKMRLLGPNTIGMVNVTNDIPLSPSGALEMDDFPKGSVSVVSQSGGILGALLSRAAAAGIGLSKLVSTSNEADLSLADFVDYLVDDPVTKIILLYVESIRHPEKFRQAALRAKSVGKPIIVYKVGKSEAGMQAAISHTGALAGSDRIYDALFLQVGIIRAKTFSDFLDIPAALISGKLLQGKRVAILTSTGGAGTLVADSLGECGFETPVPDPITAQALRNLQPGDQAVLDRNPIDVTLAGLQPDLLRGAIRALLESPSYDALIIVLGSSSVGRPELMANAVQESMQNTNKPVIAYVSPHAPLAASIMTKLGVPAYSQAESCSLALTTLLQIRQLNETFIPEGNIPSLPIGFNLQACSGSLNEYQAKDVFTKFGIACVKEMVVKPKNCHEKDLQLLGEKLVVKILSSAILHKTEVGGVALDVPFASIENTMQLMQKKVLENTGLDVVEFLVQEMLSGGIEMMVGMYRDPLGTAILVGMGGVTAELFKDSQMRLLYPGRGLSEKEALDMLSALKTWPLLDGYRGRAKCDVKRLVQTIVCFSEMVACLNDRILEAEINPIFVFAEGQGVRAADGILIFNESKPTYD